MNRIAAMIDVFGPTCCPRCEAEQEFVPRMRESKYGWLEEYLRCTICRYTTVIRTTTPEIEDVSVRLRLLSGRAEYEYQRLGAVSATLSRTLTRLEAKLSKLIGDLAQEVAAHGKPTHSDSA